MYSSEIEGSSPLADTIVYASLAELVYAAYKTTFDLYLIAHNKPFYDIISLLNKRILLWIKEKDAFISILV
jgi:hypothetical protein